MNRVLSALAVAALVVLSDGHATAQQPAPSAAQGQPSASHLAAAREVVNLSGMGRSFDAVLPRFGEAIRKNAVTRPDLTKDLDDVLEKLKPELELQKQQMVTASARIFGAV